MVGTKRWPSDKANHMYLYKLLYVIEGVKSIFDKVTSWPHDQLISKFFGRTCLLKNAASDWPCTFFTPQVFLFSISLLFVDKYY